MAPPPTAESTATPPVVWRTGMLFKKGKKAGLFSRANWKPRYVVLTSECLKYYKIPGGPLKGKVDLRTCTPQDIEMMPADCFKTGNSSSSIWRIGIQTPTRRFFIATQSSNEMDVWFKDLVDITAKADAMLPHATATDAALVG
ncbi:Aste57867_23509 [Aphanomyces stellatus]|uniref:Aste57867_23509 protein n=1 Tax=Aphanomyces stellatus TaxID=120398 RepID=A0A485LNP9_9STRA|nr:hypothetical protein As57867_023438 [Aphanomyces stellatus]VFU00154.1 Aste57867_23509 [Aphanomyces stellatus]